MGLFNRFRRKAEAAITPEMAGLIEKLQSEATSVRMEAATALAALGAGAKPASEALEEAINDSDGEVCNMAAQALSNIRRES